jgi:hypothetical protein
VGYLKEKFDVLETVRYCMIMILSEQLLNVPGVNDGGGEELKSLTTWSWAFLEKPPVTQLFKNFPAFYGTLRFITLFTKALHWSLS